MKFNVQKLRRKKRWLYEAKKTASIMFVQYPHLFSKYNRINLKINKFCCFHLVLFKLPRAIPIMTDLWGFSMHGWRYWEFLFEQSVLIFEWYVLWLTLEHQIMWTPKLLLSVRFSVGDWCFQFRENVKRKSCLGQGAKWHCPPSTIATWLFCLNLHKWFVIFMIFFSLNKNKHLNDEW